MKKIFIRSVYRWVIINRDCTIRTSKLWAYFINERCGPGIIHVVSIRGRMVEISTRIEISRARGVDDYLT